MIRYLGLFVLLFISCTSTRLDSVEIEAQRINDTWTEDPEINQIILPYKTALENEMNVVLCTSEIMLEKGKPESTLTNWFADLLQESTSKYFDRPADFSVQNYGGLRRNSLPKGDITVGLIYELMPFENMLVILHLTGAEVLQFANNMSRSGGWPVSKNLRFEINGESAQNITVNGEGLRAEKVYRVAMPDYVANGGDRMGLPRTAKREESTVLLREAVIEELKGHLPIQNNILDGRIKIK